MNSVRALLYVGGYVIVADRRVGYSIPAARPIKIFRSIKFSQLVNKVHRSLLIDPSEFCIKLSTKYSYNAISRYIEVHVYITDDDSLQFMIDLPDLQCLYLYIESSPIFHDERDYNTESLMPVITQGFTTMDFNDQLGTSTRYFDELPNQSHSGINPSSWDHHITIPAEENVAWGPYTTRVLDFGSIDWDHHITEPSPDDVAWGQNTTRLYDLNSVHKSDELFGDSYRNVISSDSEPDTPLSEELEDDHVDHTNTFHEDDADDMVACPDEGPSSHVPVAGAILTQASAHEPVMREIPQFLNVVCEEQIPDSIGIPSGSQSKFYNPERPELCVKMFFKSKIDLIASVKDYSVRVARREYIVVQSSPTIWKVRCKNKAQGGHCMWGLRASLKQNLGFFKITKYGGDHTCISSQVGIDHHNLDVNMVASTLLGIVRCDPAFEIKYVQESIKEKYGYEISYAKVWQSLKRAVETVYGTWESSVSFLSKYMGALYKYNPGTIIEWKHLRPNDKPYKILNFVFWAFKPCVDGFRHCRNIIGVDGTHLCTKYKHKMLIAVTLDANNQVLPLAFALVDEENYESWHWFLHNLARHVTRGRRGMCLISDRYAGITSAVQERLV